MFEASHLMDDDGDADDNSSNNDGSQIVPCCTSDNEQSKIKRHCAPVGNNDALQLEYERHEMDISSTCNLSTTIYHLVPEDVTGVKINQQLAKHECHAEMAEVPDEQNNSDEGRVPIHRNRCLTQSDSSNNKRIKKDTIETITKQIPYFPPEHPNLSIGHLYRINIPNNGDLGFIVPWKSIKLPMFNIYANGEKLGVEIVYIGPIDYEKYKTQLEEFCRYVFEEVFDNMNIGSGSILKFDFERSTFKLLPCFLKKSGDIDNQRMASIRGRKNKLIQNLSELTEEEVYIRLNSPNKQLYSYVSANLVQNSPTAAMKRMEKPDENYLKDFSKTANKKKNTSSTIFDYFPVEVLRYAPVNQADLQLIYKLPSILVRISQLYDIEQLSHLLAAKIPPYSLFEADQTPTVTFTDCLTSIISSTQSTVLPLDSLKYDLLLKNNCQLQPSPDLLFQSITGCSADENADMENLEILGDSFLKLVMSISVYHRYPLADTDVLTKQRSNAISNEILYQISARMGLKYYLNTKKVIFCGNDANWIPPGFTVDKGNAGKYLEHKVKRKAFADMIEALIGAYLISTDPITTIKLIAGLGLDAIPTNDQDGVVKTPSVLRINTKNDVNDINKMIKKFYDEHLFIEIEEKINYDFRDKGNLIAAFTHPSYSAKPLTTNYKRLKFIGDALLEFLITRYIFITKKSFTPGGITNIRQDLLNKSRKAEMLVVHELHGKILCSSPKYRGEISLYADNKNLSIDKDNINRWPDSEVPTALACVFDGLLGAIFVDSNYSLRAVWDVIFYLFRQCIDHIIEHPNIHPVQSFAKQCGEIIGYASDEQGNYICTIKLSNGKEIVGHGKGKKKAKQNAYQKAKKQ